MQENGQVKSEEHSVRVLNARQDLTGADRQHAQNYQEGDVVRYSKGSKPLGIEAGEYAQVVRTDEKTNTVTVESKSGQELSYGIGESFHGKLREECLRASLFRNLFDARVKIADWRK